MVMPKTVKGITIQVEWLYAEDLRWLDIVITKTLLKNRELKIG
jgi:hypothetical protein